jgi:hypothetical protein
MLYLSKAGTEPEFFKEYSFLAYILYPPYSTFNFALLFHPWIYAIFVFLATLSIGIMVSLATDIGLFVDHS